MRNIQTEELVSIALRGDGTSVLYCISLPTDACMGVWRYSPIVDDTQWSVVCSWFMYRRLQDLKDILNAYRQMVG